MSLSTSCRIVLLSLLILASASTREAQAADTPCFCRFTLLRQGEPLNAGVEMKARRDVRSYSGSNPFTPYGSNECKADCAKAAQQDPAFSDPGAACSRLNNPSSNNPFNGRIAAIAEGDRGLMMEAFSLPRKCCVAAVPPPPARCAPPWVADASGPGQLKCRRKAGSIAVEPPPPPGTRIGDWGVVLGNEVWQWGPLTTAPPRTELKPCS